MFHTERLEIHPDFGVTLEQVFNIIKREDPLGGEYFGPTMQPMTGPALVCSNPYATSAWVAQHPEWTDPSNTYLHYNKSEHAIFLLRNSYLEFKQKEKKPKAFCAYTKTEQAFERLEHALFNSNIAHLDTYLDETLFQGLSFYRVDRWFKWLCSQEKAIPFISKHLEHANWDTLSANPAAIDLLLQHPDKINYQQLCKNTHPEAIALLRSNPSSICWNLVCANPAEEAVALLLEPENAIRLSPYWLSHNTNPRALRLLWHRTSEINWEGLSRNPSDEAVDFLEAHVDKIHLAAMCRFASTPRQFALLRSQVRRFKTTHWKFLCENPNQGALPLLKEHPQHIPWPMALRFQNLFEITTEYDYAGIRAARRNLHEEYHAWAGHPVRVLQKARDWKLEVFADLGEEEEAAAAAEASECF